MGAEAEDSLIAAINARRIEVMKDMTIGGICSEQGAVCGNESGQLPQMLQDRNRDYGDFTHQAALAQKLKDVVREHLGGTGWARMTPYQREALDMNMHKVARIVNGDPHFVDSWVDIAGYAQITADRCKKRIK